LPIIGENIIIGLNCGNAAKRINCKSDKETDILN
jgi:hypothetical protein